MNSQPEQKHNSDKKHIDATEATTTAKPNVGCSTIQEHPKYRFPEHDKETGCSKNIANAYRILEGGINSLNLSLEDADSAIYALCNFLYPDLKREHQRDAKTVFKSITPKVRPEKQHNYQRVLCN